MKIHAPLALTLLLAACTTEGPLTTTTRPQTVAVVQPQPVAAPVAAPAPAVSTRPIDASGAAPVIEEVEVVSTTPPPPPSGARTAEEFDTTTPEERVAAAAPPPATPAPAASASASGDGRLGSTVASLGAADEPGFWIKTPLVNERKPGRLFYAATGRNVQVQLIPSSDGGSQVSLAAMRLLDAPLDGLPELIVYAN